MVCRKNIGTSTSEFPLGGAHGQCKRLPTPSRKPKVDGISLFPLAHKTRPTDKKRKMQWLFCLFMGKEMEDCADFLPFLLFSFFCSFPSLWRIFQITIFFWSSDWMCKLLCAHFPCWLVILASCSIHYHDSCICTMYSLGLRCKSLAPRRLHLLCSRAWLAGLIIHSGCNAASITTRTTGIFDYSRCAVTLHCWGQWYDTVVPVKVSSGQRLPTTGTKIGLFLAKRCNREERYVF